MSTSLFTSQAATTSANFSSAITRFIPPTSCISTFTSYHSGSEVNTLYFGQYSVGPYNAACYPPITTSSPGSGTYYWNLTQCPCDWSIVMTFTSNIEGNTCEPDITVALCCPSGFSYFGSNSICATFLPTTPATLPYFDGGQQSITDFAPTTAPTLLTVSNSAEYSNAGVSSQYGATGSVTGMILGYGVPISWQSSDSVQVARNRINEEVRAAGGITESETCSPERTVSPGSSGISSVLQTTTSVEMSSSSPPVQTTTTVDPSISSAETSLSSPPTQTSTFSVPITTSPATISSSLKTSSSLTTSSPSNPPKLSNNATITGPEEIGIGIGIALFIILVVCALTTSFFLHKRRGKLPVATEGEIASPRFDKSELSVEGARAELHAHSRLPAELRGSWI